MCIPGKKSFSWRSTSVVGTKEKQVNPGEDATRKPCGKPADPRKAGPQGTDAVTPLHSPGQAEVQGKKKWKKKREKGRQMGLNGGGRIDLVSGRKR